MSSILMGRNVSIFPLNIPQSDRLQSDLSDKGGPCCRLGAEAGEQVAKDRRPQQYPRRVAPSRDERQGAAHAAYLARMAAHFAEVSLHCSQPCHGPEVTAASELQSAIASNSAKVRFQRIADRPSSVKLPMTIMDVL